MFFAIRFVLPVILIFPMLMLSSCVGDVSSESPVIDNDSDISSEASVANDEKAGASRASAGSAVDLRPEDPASNAGQGDSVIHRYPDGTAPSGDVLEHCRQELPGITPISGDVGTRYDESALGSSQQFELSGSGEWDDNANYRRFVGLVAEAPVHEVVDVDNRQFVAVLDQEGQGVGNCTVRLSDAAANTATVTTLASGRAPVFPKLHGFSGAISVKTNCLSRTASATLSLDSVDEVATLELDTVREAPDETIDLAFVLDVTGSMAAEIEAMKQTIDAVATEVVSEGRAKVRLALVAYRDYGDTPAFELVHFTDDLEAFREHVAALVAEGGNDTPEAVNEAMAWATHLDWDLAAAARLAFVIGDAPPHAGEAHSAVHAAAVLACGGIKVFTVATTGQDPTGRFIFRQMSQLSYATHLFLLRGGVSSDSECADYEFRTGELHNLVIERVEGELASQNQDPLDIPGLGSDRDTEVAEALEECAVQASADEGEDLSPVIE